MLIRSEAWRAAMRALDGGRGLSVTIVLDCPEARLLIASRPLLPAMLPPLRRTLVALAAFGEGLSQISQSLAEDRTVRIGQASCQFLVTTETLGVPLPHDAAQVLLRLENHPVTAWLALWGVPIYDGIPLISGRFQGMRLERNGVRCEIVDGVQRDHRPLSLPVGASLFPAAGEEERGRLVPLIFGAVRNLAPILVEGAARGTLAVALPASAVTEIVLNELPAPFPASDPTNILIGGVEVATYTGRRQDILADGTPVLILTMVSRSTPLAWSAGTGIEVASPVRHRYVIGRGIPGIEVRNVRVAGAVAPPANYTILPALPGITPAIAAIDFHDFPNGEVTVDVDVIAPAESVTNGGFETGTLAGWTLQNGTVTVTMGETFDGVYKASFDTAPTGQEAVLSQALTVRAGLRYVLNWAYNTPQGSGNVLANGDWAGATTAPWTVMPSSTLTIVYPGPLSYARTLGASIQDPVFPASTVSYRLRLTQTITVVAGMSYSINSIIGLPLQVPSAAAFRPAPDLPPQGFLPLRIVPVGLDTSGAGNGQGARAVMILAPLDSADPLAVYPYYASPGALRDLRPTTGAPSPLGLLYEAVGRWVPTGTSYLLTIDIEGRASGSPPHVLVYPLSIIQSAGATQATGLLSVGDTGDPVRYGTVSLPSWGGWRPAQHGWLSQGTDVVITARASFPTPAAPLWLDAVRLEPPGRNPVAIMRRLFEVLLPHLALATASWDIAERQRDTWAFSGAFFDVQTTEEGVRLLAQQAGCVVQKNAAGAYAIIAEDPDAPPVQTFRKVRDVLEHSVTVTYAPPETLCTEYVLTYARDAEKRTTREAGQYGGIVYCNPDGTSHHNKGLAMLCQQALRQANQARRFTYHADAITEVGTAHRLLEHFARRHTALRREVSFRATLAAAPVEVGDVVQIVHPMIGAGPFAGEVIEKSVIMTAQAPGPHVGLTLREWGVPAGVSEGWELPSRELVVQVSEGWEDTGTDAWLFHASFAHDPPLEAIYAFYPDGTRMLAAAGSRHAGSSSHFILESAPEFDPHFWTDVSPASAWGTAIESFGGNLYAAGRNIPSTEGFKLFRISPWTEIWELAGEIWSLRTYAGNLYVGTEDGQIWQWDGIAGSPTLVASVVGGTYVRSLIDTGAALIALVETPTGVASISSATGNNGDWSSPVTLIAGATRTAPVVSYNGLWYLSANVGTDVRIYSSMNLTTWTLVHTFVAPSTHFPTALQAFDGMLYVARGNTLEIWAYDGTSWEMSVDLTTITPLPPHTGADALPHVTALGVVRGRLFACTGVFEDVTVQNVRIYVFPIDDVIP